MFAQSVDMLGPSPSPAAEGYRPTAHQVVAGASAPLPVVVGSDGLWDCFYFTLSFV